MRSGHPARSDRAAHSGRAVPEVHALGQVDGALGSGVGTQRAGSSRWCGGSLFGGGGSLSNRCLSRGSLSDRLDCRLSGSGCPGQTSATGSTTTGSATGSKQPAQTVRAQQRSLNNVLLGSNRLSNNRLDNRRYGSFNSLRAGPTTGSSTAEDWDARTRSAGGAGSANLDR